MGLAIAWLALGVVAVQGQMLANPVIGDFEIAPAGSLEWELLSRLDATGQYQQRDLPRLARLTVLESIAMYENLRADLRGTITGARLEGEMTALWDAAELFYVSTSSPSRDPAGLTRERALLVDVQAAYRRIDAVLGQLPGQSPGAALHLGDIARLLPVIQSVFDSMEADALGTTESLIAGNRPPGTELREASGRLVESLRDLTRSVAEIDPPPADRDGLIGELNGLLDVVEGFDRLVIADATTRDRSESLRRVRSRLEPIEARLGRLAVASELSRRWRDVRRRIHGLSDDLGLPRVISLAPAIRPAPNADRRLLAQVDRAVSALDRFRSDRATRPSESAEGLSFHSQAATLRQRLLQFRQLVAANESTGLQLRSLREIHALNRQLGDRLRTDRRVHRGGTPRDPRSYLEAAGAIDGLRVPAPDR